MRGSLSYYSRESPNFLKWEIHRLFFLSRKTNEIIRIAYRAKVIFLKDSYTCILHIDASEVFFTPLSSNFF